MENQFGWVSKNKEWAAVPFGKKFMLIYRGQQVSVHNTIETAIKTAMKETKHAN